MTRKAIDSPTLSRRIMSAEAAAALIAPGTTVGMSGFTGSGYPKAVPMALAARIEAAHAAGQAFQVKVWTGASTGPELDGALAKANGVEFRLPYNSDPLARDRINRGEMDYFDMHLSQVAPMAWQGFLGPLDVAVVEVTGVRPDGSLIPSSSRRAWTRSRVPSPSWIVYWWNTWPSPTAGVRTPGWPARRRR